MKKLRGSFRCISLAHVPGTGYPGGAQGTGASSTAREHNCLETQSCGFNCHPVWHMDDNTFRGICQNTRAAFRRPLYPLAGATGGCDCERWSSAGSSRRHTLTGYNCPASKTVPKAAQNAGADTCGFNSRMPDKHGYYITNRARIQIVIIIIMICIWLG
jgi:hypothetical protein